MRSAIILTLVVVAALFAVPLSAATTINATINTSSNEGYVNATSNYVLYFTYPANSSTSQQLNGTVIWYNATSFLNSTGRSQLGQYMNQNGDHQNQGNGQNFSNDSRNGFNQHRNPAAFNSNNTTLPTVHVVNATLEYQIHAFANATNLTVFRNLTINLRISNITKQVGNNTTVIDMSWRAFGIQGEMMSHFKGDLRFLSPRLGLNLQTEMSDNMDINTLGGLGNFGNSNQGLGNFQLGTLFANGDFGSSVMNYNTINFHVFSVPLQNWTRNYDNATNSTTFSYNINSNYSLNSSMTINNETYTLKLLTDPSAAITISGYATATSANELVVSNTAASSTLSTASIIAVIGVVAIVAIGISAGLMRRRSRKN